MTCDVQLTIVKGEALLSLNPGGTSNPYVIATIGAQSVSTPVVNKSVNPTYHHTFVFKDCPLPAIMTLRVLNKLPYVDLEDPMGVATVTLFGESEEQCRVVPLGHGGNASLAQRAMRGCGALHICYSAVASVPMSPPSAADVSAQVINNKNNGNNTHTHPSTPNVEAAAASAVTHVVAPAMSAPQALVYPHAHYIQGEPALPVAVQTPLAAPDVSASPPPLPPAANTPPAVIMPNHNTANATSSSLSSSAVVARTTTPPSLVPPSVTPAAVPSQLHYLVPAHAAEAPASSAAPAPLHAHGLARYTSYFVPQANTDAGDAAAMSLPAAAAAQTVQTTAPIVTVPTVTEAGLPLLTTSATTTYYASNNAVTGEQNVATPPTTVSQTNTVVPMPVASSASESAWPLYTGHAYSPMSHTTTTTTNTTTRNTNNTPHPSDTTPTRADAHPVSAASASSTINPHDPALLARAVELPHAAHPTTSPSSLYTTASQAPAVQRVPALAVTGALAAASASTAALQSMPAYESAGRIGRAPTSSQETNVANRHKAGEDAAAMRRDVVELSRAALPAVAHAPSTRPLSSGASLSRRTTPAGLVGGGGGWAPETRTRSAVDGPVTRAAFPSAPSTRGDVPAGHAHGSREEGPSSSPSTRGREEGESNLCAARDATSSSRAAAFYAAERVYLLEAAASGRDVAIFHTVRMMDPRLTRGFTDCVDYAGSTLLHIAAWNGQLAIVQLLLGPYPELPELDLAALRTRSAGNTILHAAASGGQLEVVHWLLYSHPTAGSLLRHARNLRHMTPADCAREAGFDSVARVLVPLGE